ncbi:hypothetical protein FSP39_015157 [Pinctada imbricata]|uniref:RBR-type E3 ubiquitin transferase n=1 Tax=Pinctada imbricata TaxID=66713 RepID=A0AA89BKR6_PINIB|nr:hypothetical protein FSP39_015157 [Pinctada imbricata]
MSLPTLEDVVQQYRFQLREGILRNEDLTPITQRLLNLDCDLADRYVILTFHQLLADNSQSLDQLKGMGMAFNIFEKYCRHLLKPPAQRSQMWRFVKFTNNIFRDRVDIVKGGRNIMRQMGYVQDIQDGLSFPPNTEPNAENLTFLLAEILYAKKELDLYLLMSIPILREWNFILPIQLCNVPCSSPAGQYNLSPSPGHGQGHSPSMGQGQGQRHSQGYVQYNIPPEMSQERKLVNTPPIDACRSKIQNYRPEGSQDQVKEEDPKPCDINQVVKSPDFTKMPVNQGTVYQNYPRPDLPPPVLERIPVNKPSRPSGNERKKSEGYQSAWICQHCTYHNNAGTNVCEICFKTSTNPTLLDAEGDPTTDAAQDSPMLGNSPRPSVTESTSKAPSTGGAGAGASSLEGQRVLQKAAEAGKFLKDDIDHILLEKQEARRKFEEQQKKEEEEKVLMEKRKSEERQMQRDQFDVVEVSPSPVSQSEQRKSDQSESSNQNASSGEIKSSVQSQVSNLQAPGRRDSVGRLSQETKERSSSPVAGRGESVSSGDSPKAAGKATGRTNLSFTETMDKINRERQHHQMMIESKELIQYIKTAEKAGFDIEEATIAMEKENSNTITAMTWLKEKWQQMVTTVITLAANEGSNMRQNEVGEVSDIEAREALKESKGSVPKAVKVCVQNRQKTYKELVSDSQYPREEVLHAMHQSNGDTEEAMNLLNSSSLKNFIDRLWAMDDDNLPGAIGGEGATAAEIPNLANDVCNSVTNSLLGHVDFQNMVANKELNFERRARMIMVEGKLQSWGRAHTVIRILDIDVAEKGLEATLEDIVEAVRNCGDRQSSLAYLQQECQLCFCYYPMGKIRSLNCTCKMCVSCMKSYFEINIREKHVRNLCCPICQLPDMENVNQASDYFTFLTMLLTTILSNEILDLYHSKLRDWHLQKDPNFRWCSHCGGGFLYADGEQNLAMTCPHCKKKTCFKCKKQWEDQHEGLTCEEYVQWKIDNDPENQAMGLAAHLEANGIDCPSCKMRYSLAKGGCMHFTCPQCGHQFCSGCGQMFDSQGMCTKYRSCRGKGLHCHHPRDCFYYLRDNDIPELQKLLKDKNVNFNTEIPSQQEPRNRCPVMEQKEINDAKQDEACGREIQQGHAGLCLTHYKEYLVGLINKNKLDPVHMMKVEELVRLIERDEKTPPQKKGTDREAQYRKRLIQVSHDSTFW